MRETFREWGSKALAFVKQTFQKYWLRLLVILAVVCSTCVVFTILVSYLKPPQSVMVVIMLAGILSLVAAAVYADIKADSLPVYIVESGGDSLFLLSLRQLFDSNGNVNELAFWLIFIAGNLMAIVATFFIVEWANDLQSSKSPTSNPIHHSHRRRGI